MQLCLTLRGRDVSLPMAYRHLIQGMIYHVLADHGAADLAARLHDEGYAYEDRRFKLFTFSPLSGSYTPMGRHILFQESVRLEIRSPQKEMIEQLAHGFAPGSQIQLGNNQLEVTSAQVENRRCLRERAVVAMVSPVLLYRTTEGKHTIFLSPEEEAFARAAVRNAQRKWLTEHAPEEPFALTVHPLPEQRWRKETTSFKHTFLTAWYGHIEMSGTQEVIDFLYQTGIGAKNSQGFGMFRVVS